MGGMGQVGQQLSTATGKLKYGDLSWDEKLNIITPLYIVLNLFSSLDVYQ
jgi:hypothetical protein